MPPNIVRIVNSLFKENTYVYLLQNRQCLVIDPGFDFEKIDAFLKDESLQPLAVLCTHAHFDHIASAKQFQTQYGCKVYMHQADMRILKQNNFFLKVFNTDLTIEIPVPDVLISTDEIFEFADEPIQFIHAPGHTPGGCLIKIGTNYFTGDTIYRNKIDHYNLPGLNKPQLKQTVLALWNTLEQEALMFPGHDDFDTFENIKLHNYELRKFVGIEEN